MKISEAFAAYRKNEILALGKSPKTNESYVYAEKIAVAYFGNINIRRITADSVHDFYLWLLANHAMNTARGYIVNLRAVLAFHKKRGVYGVINPDSIKTPKRAKTEMRFLTREEFERFLVALASPKRGYSRLNRERNVLIAKMLYYTGLRVSELCSLDRTSIQNRQFSVVGKSKNPRPCFITCELDQELKAYLDGRTDDSVALFIANQTGGRVTTHIVQQAFRNASEVFGKKVTPHTLRHSYATGLVTSGVDIRFIAELLGHQSLETTQRYTHVRDYRLKLVYENAMEKG
jgi:site-specific recombinase XerD